MCQDCPGNETMQDEVWICEYGLKPYDVPVTCHLIGSNIIRVYRSAISSKVEEDIVFLPGEEKNFYMDYNMAMAYLGAFDYALPLLPDANLPMCISMSQKAGSSGDRMIMFSLKNEGENIFVWPINMPLVDLCMLTKPSC